MDTDRNLLFGVLAQQAELLNAAQFAEACAAWSARKNVTLADLLVERGWLTAADRSLIDQLLQRRLQKHEGDVLASLAAAANAEVRCVLAALGDSEIQSSLAGLTDATGPEVFVEPGARQKPPQEMTGRYELRRLHATGGIGRVWLAWDSSIGREVALKELRPDRGDSPALWSRFWKEAQITGQLEHPGIVPIYELSRQTGSRQPFYVMRFVKGHTLSEAIQAYHRNQAGGSTNRLDFQALLTAFVGVCNAVAYAHGRGVLHRDLKGQNVVLGDFGEVIVLDWGLARLVNRFQGESDTPAIVLDTQDASADTVQGQVLGTPAFMAPEQAAGRLDLLDCRTDVYSLGAILYEVLTGRPPFAGKDAADVLRQVREETPVRPRLLQATIPPALEAICLRALAQKPDERYAGALEVAEDVQRWLADEPVSAHRERLPARMGRWARRHRSLVAGAGALLATAVVALTVSTVLIAREKTETDRARRRAEANYTKALAAVDQMLTVVGQDRLAHVPGMERARRKLLDEALAFYQGFLKEKGTDPDIRLETGRATQRVAKIHFLMGQYAEAEKAYRESVDLLAALAGEYPRQPLYRYELARSRHDLGLLLAARGQGDEAEETYGEAQHLWEQLLVEFPDNLDYQRMLAACQDSRGTLLATRGHMDDAGIAFRKALELRQQLVAASPDKPLYRQELVAGYGNLSNWLKYTGKLPEAGAGFRESLRLAGELVDQYSDNPEYREFRARAYHNLGGWLQASNRLDEAEKAYREALEVQEKLAAEFPAFPDHRADLASAHNNLGNLLQATGRPLDAEKALGQAVAVQEKLAAAFPMVREYRQHLGNMLSNRGNALRANKHPAEADQSYRRAADVVAQLLADFGPVPDLQSELGMALHNRADLLLEQRHFAEARQLLQDAITTQTKAHQASPTVEFYSQALSDDYWVLASLELQEGKHPACVTATAQMIGVFPGRWQERFYAAEFLARCAPVAEKDETLQPEKRHARARAYADQAVQRLREAVARGWKNDPPLRSDPAFTALKDHVEFKKLAAELEAKP